jgi:tetratricopeptide (TPR) repeat protein
LEGGKGREEGLDALLQKHLELRIVISQSVAEWVQQREKVEADRVDQIRANAATTWGVNLGIVASKPDGAAAVAVLRLASYLDPDSIPLSLLTSPLARLPEDHPLRGLAGDGGGDVHTLEAVVSRGVQLLADYSLVDASGDPDSEEEALTVFSVHRLVQAYVRRSAAGQGGRREELRNAMDVVFDAKKHRIDTLHLAHAVACCRLRKDIPRGGASEWAGNGAAFDLDFAVSAALSLVSQGYDAQSAHDILLLPWVEELTSSLTTYEGNGRQPPGAPFWLDPPALARVAETMGRTWLLLGDPGRALGWAKVAFRHHRTSRTLHVEARCHKELGDVRSALNLYDEMNTVPVSGQPRYWGTMPVCNDTSGQTVFFVAGEEERGEQCEAIVTHADLLVAHGMHVIAENLLRESAAAALYGGKLAEATVAQRLALISLRINKGEARGHIFEAFEPHRQAETPPQDLLLRECWETLAMILTTEGDYAEGRRIYDAILESDSKRLLGTHPARAATLLGLAEVMDYMGDTLGALAKATEVLEIMQCAGKTGAQLADDHRVLGLLQAKSRMHVQVAPGDRDRAPSGEASLPSLPCCDGAGPTAGREVKLWDCRRCGKVLRYCGNRCLRSALERHQLDCKVTLLINAKVQSTRVVPSRCS